MSPRFQSPTILYIQLNNFCASVEESRQPWLRVIPLIIQTDHAASPRVAYVNGIARRCGITPGMPVSDAHTRVPEVWVVRGSIDRYTEYSREFFRILSWYTDAVEPCGLDGAYLDMTHELHRWASADVFAHRLLTTIARELEVRPTIGIASTKVCARAAAAVAVPGSYHAVARGDEQAWLADQPIEQLPSVGTRAAQALRLENICTVGQVAYLPAGTALQLFGSRGTALQQLARAEDPRRVLSPASRRSLSRTTPRILGTQPVAAIVERSTQLLLQKMNQFHYQARTVSVRLHRGDGRTTTRQHTAGQPFADEPELLRTVRHLANEALQSCGDPQRCTVSVSTLLRRANKSTGSSAKLFSLQNVQNAIRRISIAIGQTTPAVTG
ncbi:MAG: hypothetical protein V1916_02820 [Patescibacteria group bacterium]